MGKLVITAFAAVILLAYMGTFRQMAGVAADPVVGLGLVRNPSPIVHSILALILLLIATVLGIDKPFGVTSYGERKLSERRQPAASSAANPITITSKSRVPWVCIAISIVTLAVLFLMLHLSGIGMRQH